MLCHSEKFRGSCCYLCRKHKRLGAGGAGGAGVGCARGILCERSFCSMFCAGGDCSTGLAFVGLGSGDGGAILHILANVPAANEKFARSKS